MPRPLSRGWRGLHWRVATVARSQNTPRCWPNKTIAAVPRRSGRVECVRLLPTQVGRGRCGPSQRAASTGCLPAASPELRPRCRPAGARWRPRCGTARETSLRHWRKLTKDDGVVMPTQSANTNLTRAPPPIPRSKLRANLGVTARCGILHSKRGRSRESLDRSRATCFRS